METLFIKGTLSDYLHKRLAQAKAAAAQVPPNASTASIEDATDQIVERFSLQPLTLNIEELSSTTQQGPVRGRDVFGRAQEAMVHGTIVRLVVPFTGERELLFLQPSSYDMNPPRARVQGQLIQVDIEMAPGASDLAPRATEARRTFSRIDEYARSQHGQISDFTNRLMQTVRATLQSRAQEADAHAAVLEQLGIPLKAKVGSPSLPIRLKQEVKVSRKAPQAEGRVEPSYRIEESDYENILSLIRHQCLTFEEAPAAFRTLEEEHLRDIIRASLNTVYSAGAETFRKKGKTDILIEQSSKAAFVAECKVWTGGKGLRDAVDQLLGYLTWRDCHASILLFNKNVADFPALLNKVPDEMAKHASYVRRASTTAPNEWRFVLKPVGGNEITCQVMIFDLVER